MTTQGAGRVLVLGATGFVGRHICAELGTEGYDVLGAARNTETDSSVPMIQFDMGSGDPSELSNLIQDHAVDTVVNTIGSIWGRQDSQMWAAAAHTTHRMIAALTACPQPPWLVHLGSVLEYGPVPEGIAADAARLQPQPTTAYGTAKLEATEHVLAASSTGAIEGVVLRIANVSGPGTPSISLLGRVSRELVRNVDTDTPFEITLDALEARRDYVDVRDVARAVLASVRTRRNGQVYDIGRGHAVPVRELVAMLVEASGLSAQIHERPRPTNRSEPDRVEVDISRAQTDLGWSPEISLDQSIRDYWASCRALTTDAESRVTAGLPAGRPDSSLA